MSNPLSRILALLTVALLVAASSQFVSPGERARGDRRGSETNEGRQKESPPEDWFITQRVTHGGIPAGALEKAGLQAAALTAIAQQADPLQDRKSVV